MKVKQRGETLRTKTVLCVLFAASLLGAMPAMAAPSFTHGYPNASGAARILKPKAKVVTIRGNSGGNVVKFAMQTARMQRDGTSVRFAGRCDSACTLYLGLPRDQMCLSPGAKFRFHAPIARSAKTVAATQRYMYTKYPGWVRNWIAANGGLSKRLITMDYGYASKFIKPCAQA